jgi:hypothetical protein
MMRALVAVVASGVNTGVPTNPGVVVADDEKPQRKFRLEKIPQPGELNNMSRRQNRAD